MRFFSWENLFNVFLRFFSKFFSKVFLGIFVVVIFSDFALGFAVPGRPAGSVADFAGIFTQTEQVILENRLENFYEKTGNPLVLVTLESLSGEASPVVATEFAQSWGVGNADRDDGILFLVVPSEREWFVAVGYGLEGQLPDGRVRVLGERALVPSFRAEQRVVGIENFVTEIEKVLGNSGENSENFSWSAVGVSQTFSGQGSVIGWFLAGVLVLSVVLGLLREKKKKTRIGRVVLWLVLFVSFALGSGVLLGLILASGFVLMSFVGGLPMGGPGRRRGGGGFGWFGGGFWGFGGGGFGWGGAGGRW